jgi:predicted SAM-dependent methyltransferase
MLSHSSKRAFYMFAGPLMKMNGLRHRFLSRSDGLRVHLGPGQTHYLPGWTNVDANAFTAKCEIWADLRNPLPFASNSIACCYSHHVVEHLPNFEEHFHDVFRCLQPGGVYRVAGPNGDAAISKFMSGDLNWFSNFPKNRKSIGGRLENFIFCSGEHITLLTESFLVEMMENVGFSNFSVCVPGRETSFEGLFGDVLPHEHETDVKHPHTLVIEALKPVL